ncbi:hypothetical protein QBC38DRAFT_485441 [Podospora fimiseda]|uniref:Uncharacterized protein n=1 Tax=Podospora fimiseda TaxID=252190 RepID=A0AAN7BJL2_9PEZI|nr:hypothetical protein QBC38DRAFT_485441 [Podospora fimiseda]
MSTFFSLFPFPSLSLHPTSHQKRRVQPRSGTHRPPTMTGAIGGIKTPSSPSDNQPGLVDRLLRRRQSKLQKGATISTNAEVKYVSIDEVFDKPPTKLPLEPPKYFESPFTSENQQSEQILKTTKMQTRTQQQPPTLRKRASFRDRIKSWQKPASTTPLQSVEEQEAPTTRFVYQPKHAASDFSRTAIPHGPLPNWKPTAGPRELEAVNGVVGGGNKQPRLRRTENRPTAVSNNIPPPPQFDAGRRPSQSSHGQTATTSHHRYSASYAENPPLFASSAAAVHIPVADTPQQQFPVVVNPPHHRQRSGQQSDFQRFMAEAEARERARAERDERIKRSFSHPMRNNRVPANPHIQYASATSRSSSAEVSGATTAVAPGGGSRNSSRGKRGEAKRNSGHFEERVQVPQKQGHKRSHTRNSSWTASYTSGASGEEKKAAAITQVYRIEPTTPVEQKALKRQVSISQKIAEYIRPPKQEMRGRGWVGTIEE